ncbi:hypothetical protein [Clostridium botulinum]|uniref:hypothetical protein n=1 Tax=Clostridium botulinum TaxID=1491 RepID=UPI001E39C722|nr:hypothetical protein [Clostridium botulinum]MCD3276709.1 hypothetical protein [Clostridium botulinum C/D]MCD3288266.1 hypothetical protein [Clostridium botulinum C/D]MCD3290817.1 hypothetical protein [Clostridium botulinum C/D]MCD3303801.1 hypothetical protein [Clostridium botulinum C/D]
MATPYDFAERQCQLANKFSKLVVPTQAQLNLMEVQNGVLSDIARMSGDFQNTYNSELAKTIRNFQNNFKSLVDTQMCQPIVDLQGTLSTLGEAIANQQTAFNKMPKALQQYVQHVNDALKDLQKVDIKNLESNVYIPVQDNDNLVSSIKDISNYIENDIAGKTTINCSNEQLDEHVKSIKCEITPIKESISKKSSVNWIEITKLLMNFIELLFKAYTCFK